MENKNKNKYYVPFWYIVLLIIVVAVFIFVTYVLLRELYLSGFDAPVWLWVIFSLCSLYVIYLLICLTKVFIQKYKVIQVYPERGYLTLVSKGLLSNKNICIQFEDIKEITAHFSLISFLWFLRMPFIPLPLTRVIIRTNRGNKYKAIVLFFDDDYLKQCLPIVEKFTLFFF